MPVYNDYYKQVAHLFTDIRLDQKEEIDLTLDVVKKYVNPEFGRLLDIGTGTGRYAIPLVRQGYKVVGLDRSHDQLKYFPLNSANAICANSMMLPFKDAEFFCCLCILMLHQLQDDERNKTLHEIFRVLRNDGYLVIKTCTHDDLHKRPFNDIFPTGLKVNLSRYPDIDLLKHEIQYLGFRKVETASTFSLQNLETPKLLHSIKNKHNSTMALIPNQEFEEGCRLLEDLLQHIEYVQIPHYHTIVVAKK